MTATEVKSRPILFSGEMVKAILAGRKTQTRRIINPQPANRPIWSSDDYRWYDADCIKPGKVMREPYGEPGDHLWVRETWLYVGPESGSGDDDALREALADPRNQTTDNVWHAADDANRGVKWTPSIHMFRWASRITLEVTGVRVERLQDISEEDAIAEGVSLDPTDYDMRINGKPASMGFINPSYAYALLWNRINGKGSWAANPWVWCISFKVISRPSEDKR